MSDERISVIALSSLKIYQKRKILLCGAVISTNSKDKLSGQGHVTSLTEGELRRGCICTVRNAHDFVSIEISDVN